MLLRVCTFEATHVCLIHHTLYIFCLKDAMKIDVLLAKMTHALLNDSLNQRNDVHLGVLCGDLCRNSWFQF